MGTPAEWEPCKTADYGPCVFPFNYNGKQFQACTKVDSSGGYTEEPWCAYEVDKNNDMQSWATCKKPVCGIDKGTLPTTTTKTTTTTTTTTRRTTTRRTTT